MMEINVDSSQLERGLGKLLSNAKHTRPMMAGVAAELQSLTEENFQSESWGGDTWEPSKRAVSEKGKTLQDSGQLAASISTNIGNDFARIGTNKIYGAIHHFGGDIKAKNQPYLLIPFGNGYAKKEQVSIPARRFLPISPDGELQAGAENRLLNVALEALAKGL